ncbi:MAG: 30S ribosomal protein S20 [Thermoguttaceae bacterium]|nr:30S ribosomal protein S20 [Thermoguttaceae bacterium]MDW8078498.1 30S ribosomal protein S20 [Thermoguttaceae bacterium]
MPNTKSAAKRLRQNVRRRARNRAVKHTIKTHYKRVLKAIAAGDAQLAGEEFRLATKKIDQAAAKGVIHKNKAARLKSRLAQRLNKLVQT